MLSCRGRIKDYMLHAALTAMLAALLAVCLPAFGRLQPAYAAAPPIFVEAESFTAEGNGWRPTRNAQTRAASQMTSLWGAGGAVDSLAYTDLQIAAAGEYRLWVRYMHHTSRRGPFRLTVIQNGMERAAQDFDREAVRGEADWSYCWAYLDLRLEAGQARLQFSKPEKRNSDGYTRHLDCLLLTSDKAFKPDNKTHSAYGTQTYLRVTLGQGYEKPVYIHVFADHFRAPWYAHYALSTAGTEAGIAPGKKSYYLTGGQSTPWCNITPMLYQDSGAILKISARESYYDMAPRLAARFEFSTTPDEKGIVRVIERDDSPSGMNIVMPPDLTTPENVDRIKVDLEMANETGRLADAMKWPTIGRAPQKFPFLVQHAVSPSLGKAVTDREMKTLDYYGFNNHLMRKIGGGVWYNLNSCYSQPDRERIVKRAAARAEAFAKEGGKTSEIIYCMLTDEPTGQPTSHLVSCQACTEGMRTWLQGKGLKPADLLVNSWEEVRPVKEDDRDKYPALHLYTQRYRTHALGEFMKVQREALHKAYGADFPVNVNFSDGAIYAANFYAQGVDYFELLEEGGQNAIWSEDWSNGSSTFQCASFNVALMRAAARRHGQHIGHHLIAYAGRTGMDTKLKAVSEAARGVKALMSFFYGPTYASHEGTPWIKKPANWYANAEVVREIGGAEDLLFSAQPVKARTALLYSTSSDAWTVGRSTAYGFDRMHIWLALAHAQVPVDILSERDAADGFLNGYQVCYLSGPNIGRAAALKLKEWVAAGGTLVLTAGAGSRDEYNRPLSTLEEILPARRGDMQEFQRCLGSGRTLETLKPANMALIGKASLEVLSLRQDLQPGAGAKTEGSFKEGGAAMVQGACGKGRIYCLGLLPGLSYIRPALAARKQIAQRVEERKGNADGIATAEDILKEEELTRGSYNPWEYPSDVREAILQPVRAAGVVSPVDCSLPVVDAVLLEAKAGSVLALANWTLQPQQKVDFKVRTNRPVQRVESVHQGALEFTGKGTKELSFSLPLQTTDFIKLYY